MKRKICVITGTRADYGILYPIMNEIKKSKTLRLFTVATCMHLMKEFGYTVKEIEQDGFHIDDKIDISYSEDSGEAIANSIGSAMTKLAKCFQKIKPDIVLVLGDRGEMLAASIASNYMNIPIAHIHGGEVSGHIDGLMRHAITKLAHIHFPATQKAKERIIKLGEEAWRVKVTGAPALDKVRNSKFSKKENLIKKYQLNGEQPIGILVQHPVSTEQTQAKKQIQNSLDAITKLKLQTVVVYPNADAGGRAMIREIKKSRNNPYLKHFKNINHEDYLGLLKIASVLIGNSSSGIIEAPSFHLPVVNIGQRQNGRQRSGNVIDVTYNKNRIQQAIKKALIDKNFKKKLKKYKNPYGDGQASRRIVDALSKIKINKRLLEKKITY